MKAYFIKMPRSFGKYRSRRSKTSEEEKKKKQKEPEEEEPEEFESEEEEENPKGGGLLDDAEEMGGDYLKTMNRDTQGALQGLLPNRLHVDTLEPDLLAKTVSVLDDHQYKGLKHAANYILGKDSESVFHHRHRASQPMQHFQKIAESKRGDLARELAGSGKMHRAVHEAMHSAHLGGGFDFSHAIHVARHMTKPIITKPVGGSFGFDDVVNAAKHVADPIEQVVAAKSEYDAIKLNDWSAKGMASNVGHAYAGNFRVGAAHLKAASLVAPVFAGALIPASEGFVGISKGFSAGTKLL
jgi:hypothetical protein